MDAFPDDVLLARMEAEAIHMAWGAGASLARNFGKSIEVEYKQKGERDPVTSADRESEAYLKESISSRFPEHGILSEEDSEEQKATLPDTVWVLDPLDGTTNFLNGFPLYAVSIGVLHLGIPVVGVLYIPWPVSSGGTVLHARKGGGAFLDEEPLTIGPEQEEPRGNRMTTLPGSFGAVYRFRKEMRGKVGEVRLTGSIAYEIALVTRSVVQYAFTSAPHIWDVAAGTLLVTEAGGASLLLTKGSRNWQPVGSLVPGWEKGITSHETLRKWSASMIFGNPRTAHFVANNLRRRRRPLPSFVKGMVRRIQGNKKG